MYIPYIQKLGGKKKSFFRLCPMSQLVNIFIHIHDTSPTRDEKTKPPYSGKGKAIVEGDSITLTQGKVSSSCIWLGKFPKEGSQF